MRLSKKWQVNWIKPYDDWFTWGAFRLNGGGYIEAAAPYHYWRVGYIFVRKYL